MRTVPPTGGLYQRPGYAAVKFTTLVYM
jgi:hypothetical protein